MVTPKLTDFGISRLKYELSIGQTMVGFWSPGYAAPEQACAVKPMSYSLGAVYYHLLSRKAPWRGRSHPDDIVALVNIPKPIRNLLTSMREVDPRKRPGDAAQVQRRVDPTEAFTTRIIHFVVSDTALPG